MLALVWRRRLISSLFVVLLPGCSTYRPFIDLDEGKYKTDTLAGVSKYAGDLRKKYNSAAQLPITYNSAISTIIIPVTAFTVGMIANGEQSDAPQIASLGAAALLAGSSIVGTADRQRIYVSAASALSCMQGAAAAAGSFEFQAAANTIGAAAEDIAEALIRYEDHAGEYERRVAGVGGEAAFAGKHPASAAKVARLRQYGADLRRSYVEAIDFQNEIRDLEGAAARQLMARIGQLQNLTNAAVLRTVGDPVQVIQSLPGAISSYSSYISNPGSGAAAQPAIDAQLNDPPNVDDDPVAQEMSEIEKMVDSWERTAAADRPAVVRALLTVTAAAPKGELRAEFANIGVNCIPNVDGLLTALLVADTQLALAGASAQTSISGGVPPYGLMNVPDALRVKIEPVRSNLARLIVERASDDAVAAEMTLTFLVYDASPTTPPIAVMVTIPAAQAGT